MLGKEGVQVFKGKEKVGRIRDGESVLDEIKVIEAKKQQAMMLVELRELGLIGIIEKLTGPILPTMESDEEDTKASKPWVARFPPPTFLSDGRWNGLLSISVETHPTIVESQKQKQYSVHVKYNQKNRLKIFGEEITYDGQVQKEKKEQVGKIEDALTSAFLDPKGARSYAR